MGRSSVEPDPSYFPGGIVETVPMPWKVVVVLAGALASPTFLAGCSDLEGELFKNIAFDILSDDEPPHRFNDHGCWEPFREEVLRDVAYNGPVLLVNAVGFEFEVPDDALWLNVAVEATSEWRITVSTAQTDDGRTADSFSGFGAITIDGPAAGRWTGTIEAHAGLGTINVKVASSACDQSEPPAEANA